MLTRPPGLWGGRELRQEGLSPATACHQQGHSAARKGPLCLLHGSALPCVLSTPDAVSTQGRSLAGRAQPGPSD